MTLTFSNAAILSMHTLRQLRIGARLGVGFGLLLALLALLIVTVDTISERNRDRSTAGVQTAHAKEMLANAMKSALLESAVAMRNIGLQSEVGAMQKEEARVKAHRKSYLEAREKLTTMGLTSAEQANVDTIDALDKQMERHLNEALGKALAFDPEGAAKTIALSIDPPSQQAVAEINKLVAHQQRETGAVFDNNLLAQQHLRNVLYLIGAIAVAIGMLGAWLITRSITQPLHHALALAQAVAAGNLSSQIVVTGKDELSALLQAFKDMNGSLRQIVGDVRLGTDAIATASSEIAAGNLDLSSRTEQQASALAQTAASMKELAGTVEQNATNAHSANQLATAASEIAARGGTVVAQVVDTMSAIHQSSNRIVDIISVIDGIAFQTNILALNAAVEAARAGEQGRGFAVVAAEVRNLAQRSAGAAKEIKRLIDDSVHNVSAGSTLVGQAGMTMQDVVASVRRLNDIMAEIAGASREQSAGIEQINRAMEQMDQVTQQNAALVEQAAAAAESMQDQAHVVAKSVGVFQLGSADVPGLAPAAEPPIALIKPRSRIVAPGLPMKARLARVA